MICCGIWHKYPPLKFQNCYTSFVELILKFHERFLWQLAPKSHAVISLYRTSENFEIQICRYLKNTQKYHFRQLDEISEVVV